MARYTPIVARTTVKGTEERYFVSRKIFYTVSRTYGSESNYQPGTFLITFSMSRLTLYGWEMFFHGETFWYQTSVLMYLCICDCFALMKSMLYYHDIYHENRRSAYFDKNIFVLLFSS